MTTRREALEAVAASLGVGSLAGCTAPGLGSTTFEATPATVAARWNGSTWNAIADVGALGLGDDGDGAVVLPTAGAQVTVVEPVDRPGLDEVTVRSYGATHPVFRNPGGTGPAETPVAGELLAFATPTVDPPGTGQLNPAADLGAADVVEEFGAVDRPDRRGAGGSAAVAPIEFDGTPPVRDLLGAGYRGGAREVELTGSLEAVDGWVDCVRGEGVVLVGEERGVGREVSATISGTKFRDHGDHVFVVGWTAAGAGVNLSDRAVLVDRVAHPETCPERRGAGGDCRRDLAAGVAEGREALLPQSVTWMRTITDEMGSVAAETADLLDAASANAPRRDGRTRDVLSAAQDAVGRIEALNEEMRREVASMTTGGAEKGPAATAVRANAAEIQRVASRAAERVASVEVDVDGDGTHDRTIERNLDQIGEMAAVVDFSCSMYGSR